MHTLFTPAERETIKDDLINLFAGTPEINAVILIGSAATGYTDELSDIDMMTVVSDEAEIINVMNAVSEKIKARYDILCFAPLNERRLQVYLLDNFLELNFSYRTIETLEARAASWHVLYDKTGTVDSIMHATYIKFDEANRTHTNNGYQSKLTEYAEQIGTIYFMPPPQ